MTTGYLLKKFPRLSETFVLGEILRQEELGADLVVFSRRAADDEPRHSAFARLRAPIEQVPPSHELDPWRELFVEAADSERIFALLGAAVRPLAESGLEKLPKLVAEALWLLRRCRELAVEHLHVHFATDSALVAQLVNALGGPTYSVTAHAKDIYRSTVDPVALSRVIASSRFTVTVCDANVRHLESLLSPPALARVRRLYNGIDLDDFPFQAGGRAAAHLLGVGRLVEKKGFDLFIDAVAELRARGTTVRATLIGDGEERERLAAQVDRLGLGDTVELRGAVDQDAVRAAMAEATLLVLPCRVGDDGNRDALPTVLLEALAVGLPSISTPVTGVPEILDDGRCGRLVPEDDVPALADAIQELLDDPAGRARLAVAGRTRAEEVFDGRRVARILFDWQHAQSEARS